MIIKNHDYYRRKSGSTFDDVRSTSLYGPAGALVAAALSLTLPLRGAGTGTGNTYFVSPSGSDSNPCSQSSSCATPDYAVNNKASAGDTVQVAAGTYDYGSGAAGFTKTGAAGNYITVSCATRGACKIQNSSTDNTTVIEIDSNYFTFDGSRSPTPAPQATTSAFT